MGETLDYMSSRVSLAAVMGGAGGFAIATYRGYHFPARTVGRTALSTAMAATACFGAERAAYAVLRRCCYDDDGGGGDADPFSLRFASHCAGGLLGGALLGALFIRKPLRGAAFFTPIMLVTAAAEQKFYEVRREKQLDFLKEHERQQQQPPDEHTSTTK